MNEDGDYDLAAEPSDVWLASLVRHLRGWPPGVSVPPALLASWRRHLRSVTRRVRRDRRAGRDSYAISPPVRRRVLTPDDLVLDLLSSPEGQVLVGVAACWPEMVASLLTPSPAEVVACWERAAARRRAVDSNAAATVLYLTAKLGGCALPPYRDGPTVCALLAGCNVVTVARARLWRASLADARRRADVLVEIQDVGVRASKVFAPLVLWYPEAGPPRGLWPDPPPPNDDAAPDTGTGTLPASAPRPVPSP